MRIDSLSPIMARNLLGVLPKSVSGLTAATEESRPAAVQPLPAPAATPATTVQMLVAIAVANPVVERRRKLARKAERGIDMLDRLHKELIAGAPNPARLRDIVEWTQTIAPPEDPALAQLMGEIELRVRVELAKLDIEV